jgi:hypothetical protein
MINIFTGHILNALFLNAYGTVGSAVVTYAEETSSQLNDQNIWAYDAVVKTADGEDVVAEFDAMSATVYPIRNEIRVPPSGRRPGAGRRLSSSAGRSDALAFDAFDQRRVINGK